jgi:hypothetical protein
MQRQGLATMTRTSKHHSLSPMLKPTFAILTLLGLAGCSSADGPEHERQSDELTSTPAIPFRQRYFTVKRDMRFCPSPRCGGYFVQAVNQLTTRCADGSQAERCYVASIDWSALGGDPRISAATVVIDGSIQPKDYPSFGSLGVLVARGAWGSATAATPAGVYYRLADKGLQCITAPCFSISAEVLNLGTPMLLSGLDLNGVGATPEQLTAARRSLSAGTLLATGKLRGIVFPTGTGRELVASQFFLPARAAASQCQSDVDCGAGTWCRPRQAGGKECVPFVGEGKACEGFTVPWLFQRCEPRLRCDLPELIADAPGVCRSQCKSSADCRANQYCATDQLCHDDGTCDASGDCNREGNTYAHSECVGQGVCSEGRCGWKCAY